jgi:hypothetical protein
MPSKPGSDAGAASEALIQYVDAVYASPPDRIKRAKDENEARESAAKWATWVGETLRANLNDELELQRRQSPQDPVRIAALETALQKIANW